ncbi:hypothetical protein ABZX30_04240 [Streptomyces sp. NPDC004542]|uniref:hypothetical protein n=1 Tax=Streptomyces sp. NPDC004542 TaxID=3154281 RepID=UPI0033A53519
MTHDDGDHPRPPAPDPAPRVLCDTGSLTPPDDETAGALWRLAEPGRQLDANVVLLPPARRVAPHTEPDLDVLLLIVAGEGTLISTRGTQTLGTGSVAWLPHGSTRGLVAGEAGMSYLTVHRRRPGMQIRPARP